jgi:23S rRNA (adenine-N6)-dimethyltransferase
MKGSAFCRLAFWPRDFFAFPGFPSGSNDVAIIQPRSIHYSQNFLHSRRLVDQLIDGSSLTSCDDVIEIGPGRGIITEPLASRCRRVVAIEKDQSLVGLLRQRLVGFPNVDVREGDFLEYSLPRHPYKVFASIPFNVTAAIVGKLTSGLSPPEDCYLVVQREAAQRFVGSPRGTLTSVLLRPWFEPSVVHSFRRTDFDPVPNVEIVLLRLRRLSPPLVGSEKGQLFRDFVVHCFTAWQPSLAASLEGLLGRSDSTAVMRGAGIPLGCRPSAVCFLQWLRLFDGVVDKAQPRRLLCIVGSEDLLQRQQAKLEKSHRTRVRSDHSSLPFSFGGRRACPERSEGGRG